MDEAKLDFCAPINFHRTIDVELLSWEKYFDDPKIFFSIKLTSVLSIGYVLHECVHIQIRQCKIIRTDLSDYAG